MNGFQNGNSLNLEKPIPGCLGRMVNLFDLSVVARNRLLTDKPHSEGSPLSRSQSDIARMSSSGDHVEDKVIMSELGRNCSNKKPNGTPMKMLIDQEMSKEIDSMHSTPSLVAKLMGLDALPQHRPDIVAQRSHSVPYFRSSDTPSSYWKGEEGYLETELQNEFDRCADQKEYKDIYEIWQQSHQTNRLRAKRPNNRRFDKTIDEKKMAFVRQKFNEAKRLATDDKLRQSKQFQDALEVLSANKDLFLKFLQEPNSLFSQHLCNMRSIPPPPDTKRITVLRPSKMVESENFAGTNDGKCPKITGRVNDYDKAHLGFSSQAGGWKVDEFSAQPTRIVVLKPSTMKPYDIRATSTVPLASAVISDNEELLADSEHNVVHESRQVAKAISQHMRETLGRHRRDETLISSVFSNGYIGDESSFNKSYAEEAAQNLSDSEVMSPVSRRSWDYIHRLDSPYSCSSFSRASYSPESSVCREAKKRLSERWAMMASNGSHEEPKHVRRHSSTLGEMLALSDVKSGERFEEESTNREECKVSSSNLTKKDTGVNSSPRNHLLRSKSLPVSSTQYGSKDPEEVKSEVAAKARNSKTSFKGRVSSLFFSRTKKASKEKSSTSQCNDRSEVSSGSAGNMNTGAEQIDVSELKGSSPAPPASSSPSLRLNGKQRIYSENGLPLTNVLLFGNPVENPDQPSPISVLEPQSDGDERTGSESSFKADSQGADLPTYPCKSNLLDKSPLIGSIARTLSWDDSCVDTASSYPLTGSLSTQGVTEEEEEWLFYVQELLSTAGLNGEVQFNSLMERWHSPESPLDPSLRDKCIDVNDKEIRQEAKRRQGRSTRKLVFDCVNAAIIDMAGHGSVTCQRAIPYGGGHQTGRLVDIPSALKMVDQVWSRMKEWISGDMRCVSVEGGDSNSLVVETVVRKELLGNSWSQHLSVEVDILGNEIERELLEQLVQEAVHQLTDHS